MSENKRDVELFKKVVAELEKRKGEKAACEGSLWEFTKLAWPWLGEGEMVETRFARELCRHLEAVYEGKIRRLLINVPPRSSKSIVVNVMFPVWCWIKDNKIRYMNISYETNLAERDNNRSRRLINSPWFQNLWGDRVKFSKDQNTKNNIELESGGARMSFSIDGSITGSGANIICCDDPNNARDQSETVLESAWETFSRVLPTRFNNYSESKLLIIQQRLSEFDISGQILANDKDNEWVKLILPFEYESARRCRTIDFGDGKGVWEDWRTEEGEILIPERFSPKDLERLKKELGSEYTIAGQLQQRPAPAEGGMIKRKWFQVWTQDRPPECEYVLSSWDTAATKNEESAWSVCTTWGIFKDDNKIPNIILLSMWRGKEEFDALYKRMYDLSRDYRGIEGVCDPKYNPDIILVEDKSSGTSLLQMLRKTGGNYVRFNPNKFGDKMQRVRQSLPLLEAGRVWLPGKGPDYKNVRAYAEKFMMYCSLFPKGDGKDVVDTMSQALIWLSARGFVYTPIEEENMSEDIYSERVAIY